MRASASQMKQEAMSDIRNLCGDYYKVTFREDLEFKLRNILNEEKCPLTMTGYDKDDNIGSFGFAVLKCRSLNCQHVIRLSSEKHVTSNTFTEFHDSDFKHVSFKSLKSLSIASNNQNNPRRRFKMELKFCQLLSNQCVDSIYV
eukprot:520233_1